jgi:hypothetical protein
MTAATRLGQPEVWDWRQLADLGEQLVNTASLAAQRAHIISTARRLIKGKVDVWLNENLFRLPDWDTKRLFPAQPPLDGMRRAVKTGRLFTRDICRAPARGSGIYLWGASSHAAQRAWIQLRGTGPTQRAGANRRCRLVRGPSCGRRTLSVGTNKSRS